MPRKSTYFFIGRLSDQSAKYYVNEFPLSDGFFLELLFDGVAIWGSTNKPFANILTKTREALDIILAAFVFKTKKPLTYNLEHWVETMEVISRKTMIGWILNPFASREHYPRQSKKNTAWKKAAWFYNNLADGNNNHLLALKDYRDALIDVGADAFLFAYRAVEDTCRAVTMCDEIGANHWEKMHKILNTSKSQLDHLRKVSERVRHGDVNDPIVNSAKKSRDKMLNISHDIIEKELRRTFPKFF